MTHDGPRRQIPDLFPDAPDRIPGRPSACAVLDSDVLREPFRADRRAAAAASDSAARRGPAARGSEARADDCDDKTRRNQTVRTGNACGRNRDRNDCDARFLNPAVRAGSREFATAPGHFRQRHPDERRLRRRIHPAALGVHAQTERIPGYMGCDGIQSGFCETGHRGGISGVLPFARREGRRARLQHHHVPGAAELRRLLQIFHQSVVALADRRRREGA